MSRIAPLFLAILLTACGGGGSSTTGGGTTTGADWIIYSTDSAVAAIRRDGSERITLTTSPALGAATLLDYDIDFARREFSNARISGHVFFSGDRFYHVATDGRGTPTPRQVSSFQTAGNPSEPVCHVSSNDRYVTFTGPGNDGICNTSDDGPRMAIHPGMTDSTAPYVGQILAVYPFPNPADNRVLALNARGDLVLLDADLQNETVIAQGVGSVIEVGGTLHRTALLIAGNIHVFDAETETLSDPVVTVGATAYTSNGIADANGNLYYFIRDTDTSGNNIAVLHRLTLEGQDAYSDTALATVNNDSWIERVYGNLVVFERQDNTGTTLSFDAYDMTTSSIVTLLDATGAVISLCGGNGSRLYFQRQDTTTTGNPAIILWQNGTTSNLLSGSCTGVAYRNTLKLGDTLTVTHLVIVETDYSTLTDPRVTRLSSIDAATGRIVSTRDFPAREFNAMVGGFAFGTKLVGMGFVFDNGRAVSDLVTLSADDLSGFARLTNTPAVSETPLFFVF